MVKNHLSRLMGAARIKNAELARKTGIRPNTISDLYNEDASAISFSHLEAICRALNCEIADLLELQPDPENEGQDADEQQQ